VARRPTTTETILAIATVAIPVAQQYGLIQPLEKKAVANRESNYTARDRLQACEAERYKWQEKYLELVE
jgi:hypothetical protein